MTTKGECMVLFNTVMDTQMALGRDRYLKTDGGVGVRDVATMRWALLFLKGKPPLTYYVLIRPAPQHTHTYTGKTWDDGTLRSSKPSVSITTTPSPRAGRTVATAGT